MNVLVQDVTSNKKFMTGIYLSIQLLLNKFKIKSNEICKVIVVIFITILEYLKNIRNSSF